MRKIGFMLLIAAFGCSLLSWRNSPTVACCAAGRTGRPVVNADQTVIMIWDAARKTQHFIRKASFKTNDKDVGFLVPTPSVPELEESGDNAFPIAAEITAPKVRVVARPKPAFSCACSALPAANTREITDSVVVLAEKRVAGFDAKVLEATSADALVDWLKEHEYDFSPEIRAWAEPYIEQGWKITALKVAKPEDRDQPAARSDTDLRAAALRISFQTDRPLFPYREPDPTDAASSLNAKRRLLRIFFVADARYRGELTADTPWTGRVAWSNSLDEIDRLRLLRELRLPDETGPEQFWLTEFEDYWPYRAAPADLYFARDEDQEKLRRPDQIQYVSAPANADSIFHAGMTPDFVPVTALGIILAHTWWWNRRRAS